MRGLRKFHLILLLLCWWQLLSQCNWPITYTDAAADGCWNKNDCIIRATLHETTTATDLGYDIVINCMLSGMDEKQREVIEHSHILELDGVECYTMQESYGFEYIPSCNKVVQVTIRRFNSDELQSLQCPLSFSSSGADDPGGTDLSLEVMIFAGNNINTISAESFNGNYKHLRELHFHGNNLRHAYQHAFDMLHTVEVLTLVDEPQLIIKDARIVEQMNVVLMKFEGLKLITAQIFQHLPITLKQLIVRNVEVAGHMVEFSDAFNRKHIMDSVTLANCDIEIFALDDDYWQVRAINLSGNALTDLRLGNGSDVELLDLSSNKLTHLPYKWLESLNELLYLHLNDNHLKTISIRQLIITVPTLLTIDMRDNHLTVLSDESVDFEFEQMPRVRIDRNPWNCIALQKFAQTHPEKFRFFQYDKFISLINVNGLACSPVETVGAVAMPIVNQGAVVADTTNTTKDTPSPLSTISNGNVRTGAPQHKGMVFNELDHRSQRTEALIIVFMLPLGIAILFVILYMWIYCEKIFHLSYYRCAFPPFKRRSKTIVISSGRADIVRHRPPGTTVVCDAANEGYELPLNGISKCNCNNLGMQSKCQKLHHLTYVALPTERPYLIYEEIVEDTSVKSLSGTAPHEPSYDHLTFVGPIDPL